MNSIEDEILAHLNRLNVLTHQKVQITAKNGNITIALLMSRRNKIANKHTYNEYLLSRLRLLKRIKNLNSLFWYLQDVEL